MNFCLHGKILKLHKPPKITPKLQNLNKFIIKEKNRRVSLKKRNITGACSMNIVQYINIIYTRVRNYVKDIGIEYYIVKYF